MYIEQLYPQPWGLEHITMLLIAIVLNTIRPILIGKFVKKQKTIDIILIVSAVLLISCIATARIALLYWDMCVVTDPSLREYTNWAQILPDSFCAVTSFAFGISILIRRDKSNITFHCFVYMAIISFIITFIWPAFISKRPFFTVRTIFGLLHHILLLWCALILIVTKRFAPNPSKWYIMPIGVAFYLVYGIFGITVLGFADCMNILTPLIKNVAVTGWTGCSALYIVTAIVTEFSYYGYKCNKAKKLLVSRGRKTNKTFKYTKVFLLNYCKKNKVLVVCYSNGSYQAFNNVEQGLVDSIKKAKGFYKNELIASKLNSKHLQVTI